MSLENYEAKLTTGYYRVRKAWEDDDSQIGQYRLLASAVKKADENPGYSVFTPAGIAIFPEDEETVTVSEGMEEITLDAPEPTQDAQEGAETEDGKEVVAAVDEADTSGSDATEEDSTDEDAVFEPTAEEIAEAQTEALAEDEYPNDGNEETILYGRLNTLLNIREGNSLDANIVTTMKKNSIVEILEACDNGWYRIKCNKAECGYAYISNVIGTYLNVGSALYTVQPSDSLWKIAEKTLGSGTRYTDIKTANNLTSNVIRVGMELLIP